MFCGRPSLLACINSGSGISPRNLEHRRVNVRSRKSEPIRDRLKSRWSRVERKALVFFPTLNERLCFQRTIPAASLPTRALVARESSRASRLLPRLSVCDFSRGMSIYMQVIFRKQAELFLRSLQKGRTTVRFQPAVPQALRSRAEFQRESISPEQSPRYRA